MTDPADGTLLVTGANAAAPTYGAQSFRCSGVVEAAGLQPTAVEIRAIARTAKWPQPGRRLPVTVDRAHPQRVVIRWDQIPSNHELATSQANAAAFRLRTGIDPEVVARAVEEQREARPDDVAATDWRPYQPPSQPAGAPMPTSGTVIAVRDVQLPAGSGPPGGVADLTIQLDGSRIAVGRALFASAQQRVQTAVPGATVPVLIDPANPGTVTVVLPTLPTEPGG